MKIYIDDKGRHKANSGYGNLSRNYGKALAAAGATVVYPDISSAKWNSQISERVKTEFNECINHGSWQDCDVALTICPPEHRRVADIPNVLYTQNALGGLISEWGKFISEYDRVVVPGVFDEKYFEKISTNVSTCPQLVDNRLFCNRPAWREEGSNKFTFIFVGSLSYRKGVDILLQAFCEFSLKDGNLSKLVLLCPGAKNINYLLRSLRKHNPSADVDLMIEEMSQEWVCRQINRSDAFISLSRGEGWCMPLFESLLAEKPCIVPDSTAMGECTPISNSILKLPVSETRISEIKADFGKGFRSKYSEGDAFSYDVSVSDAVEAMHTMKNEFIGMNADTASARAEILENYSAINVGQKLKSLLVSHV